MKASRLFLIVLAVIAGCAPTQPESASPEASSQTKSADTRWKSVSCVTNGLFHDPWGRPSYHPHKVRTTARQADLTTGSAETGRRWWGYSGPENQHTRKLRFSSGGATYSVPDELVADLLALHVDFPTHATPDGRDQVFSMEGCSGEKYYKVHFHFRDGAFRQRILDYSEGSDIHIAP